MPEAWWQDEGQCFHHRGACDPGDFRLSECTGLAASTQTGVANKRAKAGFQVSLVQTPGLVMTKQKGHHRSRLEYPIFYPYS